MRLMSSEWKCVVWWIYLWHLYHIHTHKLLNLKLNLICGAFCTWTIAEKLNSHWPYMLKGHRETTSNPEQWGSKASGGRTACLSRAHPLSSASKNHCGESKEQLLAEMPDRNAWRQRICKRMDLFKTLDVLKWFFDLDFLLFLSSASFWKKKPFALDQ